MNPSISVHISSLCLHTFLCIGASLSIALLRMTSAYTKSKCMWLVNPCVFMGVPFERTRCFLATTCAHVHFGVSALIVLQVCIYF